MTGKKLDETVNALAEYFPYVQCLCVVPVGLTGHREGFFAISAVIPKTRRRRL